MPKQSSDAADNLQYVCDLLDQLKGIAGAEGGPFLRYLIEMARQEAADRLRTILAEHRSAEARLVDERDPAA